MRNSIIFSLFFILSLSCTMIGCASATYIEAESATNPLSEIEKRATDEYTVNRIDEKTLELRDTWVLSSIGGLGWYTSHANLFYDDIQKKLHCQYYLRSIALWTLYFPSYLHAEPGFVGGAMKGTMNAQLNEIFKWTGINKQKRRAGRSSESFPPVQGKGT